MSKNTSLPIDSLDFDDIKNNLKNYLSSQEVFSDYNFEGSGLNILLDVLAYNTHYQAFYNNMIISESFIDSATRPDSIFSLLKLLNYLPQSRLSAKSKVKVYYRDPSGQTIPFDNAILPEKRTFTTTIDSTTFNFTNPESVQLVPCAFDNSGNPTEWVSDDFDIIEGTYSSFDYVFDPTLTDTYEIPDTTSDNRYLRVFVKDSEQEDNTKSNEWKRSDSQLNIDSTSEVYFIQRGLGGLYEIYFGDNVFGKRPNKGDIISIEILSSVGSSANEIGKTDLSGNRTFSLSSEGGNFEVVVVNKAVGGSDKETSSFAKKVGPLYFQSQNRLVTPEDYRTEILRQFPQIKSLLVYGGEDAVPPQYGKVFIVANTKTSVPLSDQEKEGIIKNIIKKKNVVSIIPEFISVDYTYVRMNMSVLYNNNYTALSKDAVKSIIRSQIQDYTDNTLEDFGANFRGSKVIKNTIDSEPSIVSVNLAVSMEKRIDPSSFLNIKKDYNVLFPGGIKKNISGTSIRTNTFSVNGRNSYLKDNGNGILQLYYINGKGQEVVTNSNQGSINYETGNVVIKQLNVQNIPNDSFIRVYADTKTSDIEVSRNQILVIDETDPTSVNITMTLSNDIPS